ncbi:MAG TPA: bifunctional diaminohydroxyphosphoribosylaminopyrimidine deaminase/5-amino-6-(5-phosphoribosylamino)uracil reductase RibD, partial [Verrucomicrobiae bacterium]|nr:bifunctional diaminohydroxyphosphoribosylaminopyrimidine deaminase/5-amino-6-(5-phosphoribosylamino)uracil reductase RibD [Verrucomicrobiae bacterium]
MSIQSDLFFLRQALRLARQGCGKTSPNPMVGAVLVKNGKMIGCGWHTAAGKPHAEIEAIRDAYRRGNDLNGSTLYVTLEPCSSAGRTPPCTEAIIQAGIARVVAGTTDPNPKHRGRAFKILARAEIKVWRPGIHPAASGVKSSPALVQSETALSLQCAQLNEAFNHWITHQTPFVTVKAAMTLDGKIATEDGQSRWITGTQARSFGMKMRAASDAVLVGINTILADDPSLTVRTAKSNAASPRLRRIVLDSAARTPLTSKVVCDAYRALTTIVVAPDAPRRRIAALGRKVRVWVAPKARKPLQEWGRLVPIKTLSPVKLGTSLPHSCSAARRGRSQGIDLQW